MGTISSIPRRSLRSSITTAATVVGWVLAAAMIVIQVTERMKR